MIERDEVIAARLRVPTVRALARDRVDAMLDQVWQYRLTLVVAPAGSGKTTALAQFVSRATRPIVWYHADRAAGTASALLAHLERAVRSIEPNLADGWTTPAAAASALEQIGPDGLTIVLDDLHALRATPAETALERLLDYLPPHVHVAASSRTNPAFDLMRLRLTGDLLEVGADDLRFRTWEAEQLLRDLYGALLAPEDVARLTRRVEGWAAGFQLYHLASRSKPPAEQRRLIDVVSSRSRMAREYLTRNVLDELPDELRSFLVDTCVLGVITAPLADALLGTVDAGRRLAQLEALQLFTIPLDEEGTYRYHEVLRSHLEVLLAERDGDESVQARHRRAGELLEHAGYAVEALRCFGRAGEWEGVRRMLGGQHRSQLLDSAGWLDALPQAIVDHDPWLVLARARAARDAGRLNEAVASYHGAESMLGDTQVGAQARSERMDLAGWLEPQAPLPSGVAGLLRSGLRRDPIGTAALLGELDDPWAPVAAGALCLLGGQFRRAIASFEQAIVHPHAMPRSAVSARFGLAVVGMLSLEGADATLIDEVEATADQLGYGWLARLARAGLALTLRRNGAEEAARVRALCDADGDAWGAALAALMEGLGALGGEDAPVAVLEAAASRFRALDVPVAEATALGGLSIAYGRLGHPEATPTARAAEHLARTVGAQAARAMAFVALAAVADDANTRAEHLELVRQLAHDGGFWLPGAGVLGTGVFDPAELPPLERPADVTAGPASATRSAPLGPPLSVRCFGPFAAFVDGREVDLSTLRPRARSAFRLLAMHGGQAVHREELVENLWPGSPGDAAIRNLQVAVSSIRQVLSNAGGNGSALLVREGDTYRLVLIGDGASDVRALEGAVASAAKARQNGDHATALARARAGLAVARGELLTEEGPAEWVVGHREACRVQASTLASLIAELELGAANPAAAVEACEQGLRIDRYHDSLWRALADAHDALGDKAAAKLARRGYDDVKRELGVAG